ncbi:MAG TPA: hypothetical protein PK440_07905 [Candidatus Accumulibacter phosphatis]|nr:MAG: hypothetical protein AW07_03140 [Candidatus Accumulibacter sp. SK-11]HAY29348.1 hypothetical protein [Accumulibacter sp.]HRL76313.1 hypothetical protein [Candidatus Accumulibacter phosphatis]HRQ94909.1 hypothetical protein [Candidatus Accumulibacter phosphatis]
MAARGFLGGGDLYIDRYDPSTGLKVGRVGPFECSKFEIKANSELKEQKSKGKTTYGQVIESVALSLPADLTVELSELDKDGLTLALLGTQSVINQGSGSITDEAMIAKRDKWVSLSKANFAVAGFSVKHTSGTPTYVLGTDYDVNCRLGMVRVKSTGAIADGASVKVSGSYNASTGTRIAGATQAQVRAEFILDGINFADNLPVICTAWEAVLAPDSAFDFLGDGFGVISLKGRLKTPTGKTEPFQVDLLTA